MISHDGDKEADLLQQGELFYEKCNELVPLYV